jgi:hypothetical protein
MPVRLQPGCLTRFWLWASIGVLAMFGIFSMAGAIVWPVLGAGIGLLAARTFSRRATVLAIAVAVAAPAVMVAIGSAWALVAGMLVALAIGVVRSRRDALVLGGAVLVGLGILVVMREADGVYAIPIAPAFVILAALAAGRPQREAAGAVTGAGLTLFAFGEPAPGISLTLAGAVLMLALGLRRRRLAAAVGT